MRKGFAIAFFVVSIILCVGMVGKPWTLVDEIGISSVSDETLAEIEEEIYDIGGIEWTSVYVYDGKLDISVDGRDYDPAGFADFCQTVLDEVADIVDDYDGLEVGSLYISQYSADRSVNWYTDNMKRGYFSYYDGGSSITHDNITPAELKKELSDMKFDEIESVGGVLG